MSEKKRQDTEKLEIDIASFEEEIDREIDSLFTIESAMMPGGDETSQPAPAAGKDPEPAGRKLGAGAVSSGAGVALPGKQGDVDLSSFELQIEKEIDSLFVPYERAPTEAASSFEADSGRAETAEKGAMPGLTPPVGPAFLTKPPAETSFHEDFSIFEKELDSGIDSLFIPLSPVVEEEPSRGGMGDIPGESRQGMTARTPSAAIISAAAEGGATPKAAPAAGGSSAWGASVPRVERPPELSSLLESFSIAYLSLEWDFSGENITKFDNALGSLEPFCRKDPSVQSLHRLLKSLLHRLKTRPDSIDAELSEMVHEGQDLLRSLLISEGTRPQDKEQLRLLVQRFQVLREKGPVGRKPEEGAPAMGAGQAFAVPGQGPLPAAAADIPPKPDLSEVRGLLVRMETRRLTTEEAISGIAGECKRLLQIEGVMAKTPALAPLKIHVARIRANLDSQVSLLLSKAADWKEELEQAQRQLDVAEERFTVAVPAAAVLQHPVAPTVPLQHPAVAAESKGASGEIRKDDICLFDVSGKHFAVLASQVVKVQKISGGVAKKLLKRGYATLADFKPFFRSIKAGVFGTWSGMPDGILGRYRFIPVPPELLHVESLPAGGGVLLVSSGRNHGLIFIDSPEVDLHNETEIVVATTRSAGVLGVVGQESGEPAEVLNLEALLRMQQGHLGK